MKLFNKKLPVRDSIIIDASVFVRMHNQNPDSVRGAKIIIPKLGSKSLAKFKVPATTLELMDI